MMLFRPGPKSAISAMARTRSGSALIASMSELTIAHDDPRSAAMPSRTPTMVPMTSGIETPRKATPRSRYTAEKTRVKTSRPSWSVPKKKLASTAAERVARSARWDGRG